MHAAAFTAGASRTAASLFAAFYDTYDHECRYAKEYNADDYICPVHKKPPYMSPISLPP